MFYHSINPELPGSPFTIPVWLITILLILWIGVYVYIIYRSHKKDIFKYVKSNSSLQTNLGFLGVICISTFFFLTKNITLHIRWYGIIYALGFTYIFLYLQFLARRKSIEHFHTSDVEPFLVGLIMSMIIGARLFHVFVYEFAYYIVRPHEILMVWQGGLSFHGALFFMVLWIYYFCKKKKIEK
jgi:hypothetical protein